MMDELDAAEIVAILGHGASGTAASMRPWVEALAAHGIAARAIDLPRGRAERAVPVFDRALIANTSRIVAGGHSFGGRVASLMAADRVDRGDGLPAGLLLLSFPLHRPGAPEPWRDRVAHWPRLRLPTLVLSGESDPFARIDLLREAVQLLPDGRLVTYPAVGHGLGPVLDDAAAHAAEFIRGLAVPR